VIPTLLLVGLVVGAFVHDRASFVRSAALGAAVSVLWGIGVGLADGSIATFFGGVVFAVANVVVGTVLSASFRRLASVAVGTRHTT
jgi:predicted Co/Zn/Cd cation transporter (cation efflux family)